MGNIGAGVFVDTTDSTIGGPQTGAGNVISGNQTASLKISTVNGSIELRMPSEFNADVRFSSVNGRLNSDFPLTMSGHFGGRRVEGRIGNGGRELVVDTVNGSLRLKSESI